MQNQCTHTSLQHATMRGLAEKRKVDCCCNHYYHYYHYYHHYH